MRMGNREQDPDHWAYHKRRCPLDDCGGVVDDDLAVPRCCSCEREFSDLPEGPQALPAPAGYVWQKDVPEMEPVEAPPELVDRMTKVLKQRENPH